MGVNLAKKQDYTTPEMWKKRGITFNNGTLQAEPQTPLDFMESKSILTKEQYWAGDRFYRTFIRAGFGPRYGTHLSDARGVDTDLPIRQEDNEILYRQCYTAIAIKERQTVIDVCCLCMWPDIPEVRLLRSGLNDLNLFWEARQKLKSLDY